MEQYQYPEELKYSETHTWALAGPEPGVVVVGITAYTQANLGDIVALNLPRPGGSVDVGDEICSLDGDDGTVEVCSPLAGELIEVNVDLMESPGLLTTDPYGDGWLFKLQLADQEEYSALLDVQDYKDLINDDDY